MAYDKEHEENWEKIYNYIEDNKLVKPGYNRKTFGLSFDEEHGVLFCSGLSTNEPHEDDCGHSRIDHIKMYISSIFSKFKR